MPSKESSPLPTRASAWNARALSSAVSICVHWGTVSCSLSDSTQVSPNKLAKSKKSNTAVVTLLTPPFKMKLCLLAMAVAYPLLFTVTKKEGEDKEKQKNRQKKHGKERKNEKNEKEKEKENQDDSSFIQPMISRR